MCMCLRTKFKVSCIILTGCRQGVKGGGILPVPPPQNGPLKSPPRLGLNNAFDFPHAPTALSVGTEFGFPKK